jgi:hypothetical protein
MASDRHEFPRLATRADMVFAKYRRHFAGKSRSTRDAALLSEMLRDLSQIQADMVAHLARNTVPLGETDLDLVKGSLELYQRELGEIEKAQGAGVPDQQAELLSGMANTQFDVYRTHCAKQNRATRRPELLQRVIARLKLVHARMVALRDAGYTAEFHGKNIGIVAENLARYERELGEIDRVRRSTGARGLVPQLGDAANALFAEYRENYANKPRNTVDLERLVRLCDKLDEVRRQMDDLGATVDDEKNERNHEIVVRQQRTFQTELAAIMELRKA